MMVYCRPGIGMDAADERAADRGEMAGGQPLRHVLRQAAPHQVVDAQLDLVIEADRRRLPGVEDRALAGQQIDRPERALVAGRVRVGERLEDHLRGDHDAVAAGVDRIVCLVRIVAQIDGEFIVGDGDLNVEDAAVVLLLGQFEGALGQVLGSSARRHASPKSMKEAMAVSKVATPYFSARSRPAAWRRCGPRRWPPRHRPPARRACASSTLMISMTGRIGSPSEIILIAGRRRPSWKISVASPVSEPGAMPPTSELWAMLAVQAMMCALGEDRHDDDDVVQVGDAAVIRIVGGEDVAGLDVAGLVELRDDHLHRLVQHADEGRNAGAGAGEIAARIQNAGAHVQHLVDDRAHRRLASSPRTSRRRPPAASSG